MHTGLTAIEPHSDCIVIGAGPAGLAAAIAAAARGERVLIVEKNDRPGKKLLLTGGGRANLWEASRPPLEALEAFGREGRFLRQVLTGFDWPGFLRALRIATEADDGNSFVRGGAAKLLESLRARAASLGAGLSAPAAVGRAKTAEGGGFEVALSGGDVLRCRRLIVATGGLTWPGTGSSGDGYALAEAFGHEVDPPRPALGELATRPCFPELAGSSVPLAAVGLAAGGKRVLGRGPLLFTHAGISGPAAFDASLELARAALGAGQPLRLDLAPGLSCPALTARLVERARSETKRKLETAGLGELLTVRMLARLAELAGLEASRRMGSFCERDFSRLAAAIKALPLKMTAGPDARRAMVTVGGVSAKGLDPRTMESRLVPGLHFAGEVLTPAGPCGGYNLLMAFATGTAAGGAPGSSGLAGTPGGRGASENSTGGSTS